MPAHTNVSMDDFIVSAKYASTCFKPDILYVYNSQKDCPTGGLLWAQRHKRQMLGYKIPAS